jgi:hypothetical protein
LGKVLRGNHHWILATPWVVRERSTSTIEIEVRIVMIVLLRSLLNVLKFELLGIKNWLFLVSEAEHSAASDCRVSIVLILDTGRSLPWRTCRFEYTIPSIRLIVLLIGIRFQRDKPFSH